MEKKIIVTTSWDDGHILDLKLVGLLHKYNLKGTIYVSPFNREFDRSKLLSSAQLKKIESNSIEIGAHTMTHPRLTNVSSKEANTEIRDSKKYLERVLGKKIKSFCYPGGAYTKTNLRQVKNAGFVFARTVKTFEFGLGNNIFETATSVNAYDHYTDIFKILKFVKFNPFKFIKLYLHWDLLAIAMFDYVLKNGGIFHLWGHSWEIDNHKDWKRLEKVFAYISNNKNVQYLTNKQLI